MKYENLYRIGDFAKKLGVTPDLLKYCEKKGLIHSEKEENGYRYYSFQQAATVLEYMKLQNQGFSAGEIYDALHAESFERLAEMERSCKTDIERQIGFLQALLRRNQYLESIQELFSQPLSWRLNQGRAGWFLPHSTDRVFTSDSNVLRRLEDWNRLLPIVESACCRGLEETRSNSRQWGLYVEDSFARDQGLDVSAPAVYLPARLQLEIFIQETLGGSGQRFNRNWPALLKRLKLKQAGDAMEFVVAKMWSGEARKSYSILRIPVEFDYSEE